MSIQDISSLVQLKREDMAKIGAAANPQNGIGIEVTRTPYGYKYSISETAFKQMLWAFNHNGGFNTTYEGAAEISLDPIS